MSFSLDVKNEIISQKGITKKQRMARLLGILCFGSKLMKSPNGYSLKFATENSKLARYLFYILKKDCEIKANLRLYRGRKNIMYYVTIDDELEITDLFHMVGLLGATKDLDEFLSFRINDKFIFETNEKKAFISGAFLGSGSVISPEKNCHLEFVTSHFNLKNDMEKLLLEFELGVKSALRKSNYILYFKNSQDIADILTIIGAYDSLMEFHNAKILKEMHNDINRKMNCDNANMTKTLDASFKQANAIKKLQDKGVLDQMDDSLKQIALLRLQNKDLGLKELGAMLNPPLGKSGVNHRLRRLMREAEKYNA